MRLATAVLVAVAAAGMSAAPVVVHAQPSALALPSTPAGTILRAWLDAFDSGDSLRLDAFHRQYDPGRPGGTALRRRTGGVELIGVERAEPRHIEATLKERSGPRVAIFVLTTPSDGSMKVATLRLVWLGADASADAARIDGATRARVIEGALALLDRSYVFPDVAKRAGDSLRTRLGRGAYDPYTSGVGFAARLHDELREITRDKHVTLQYSVPAPPPAGPPPPAPTPDQLHAQTVAKLEAGNCGFVKAEVLPGNIGYLRFDGFTDVTVCGPTASAAMTFLANTRALIVDLRENTGGSPAMVAYISSYLFSQRTHLNSLWNRNTGQTHEFWTIDDVPGRRFGGEKPVYVLTAARTFSGAEEFSYNLQSRKRAVIVGETTGGGAHPVASHRIDDRFTIGVPFARATNPITKTNWEGVGVEPDVKVPASEALATVLKLLAASPQP
jgi:hypothetical protein